MMNRWDEVEREFVISARNLQRLANGFEALACALHRERQFANKGSTRGRETDDPKVQRAGHQGQPARS